ncbi:MAG: hypothetical protein OXG15_06110 [Gammaproteobacteria bacterium]|nr:hypothetical protein [Gammaproteobacteria bacterium]
MRSIWKYQLNRENTEQVITMQKGFVPLHVGLDPAGDMCIWGLVDEQAPLCNCRVIVYGTGGLTLDSHDTILSDYVGTVHDGLFVWHVFFGGDVGPGENDE